jgi:hypothetical protein
MDTEEFAANAFLDIATNLLAILLIVTLFALAAPRQLSEGANPLPAQTPLGPRFVEPQRALFPPFSRFYFVIADRVLVWDQEAVVDAIAADPSTRTGRIWQGRFEWRPPPLISRDIDRFQLKFWPDRAAIVQQAPPWSAAHGEALIAELAQAAAEARIAPVFIVQPDGMETFVPLHARLHAAGLRFRWFTQPAEDPLLIGREIAQFTHHGLYW